MGRKVGESNLIIIQRLNDQMDTRHVAIDVIDHHITDAVAANNIFFGLQRMLGKANIDPLTR